jgi:catechol 2,3-dioxygenase-like lactoylglutathione lyase family enzyme
MNRQTRQSGRAGGFRRCAAIVACTLSIAILMSGKTSANDQPSTQKEEQQTMRVRDLYPLITTPALFEARDFYVRHFGFDVLFEASWFVYLSGPGEDGTRGATLAFMSPDHPSNPPGPEAFDGRGMILTLEVADAGTVFDKLSRGGAPIVHPLTEEDWGQRRFMTRDPAGVLVDVVEQTAPKEGFWEKYPAPAR